MERLTCNSLLIENFRVISAEAVNTLDDKHVGSFKAAQKTLVLWSVEVFAALPVCENLVDAKVLKSDNLAVFTLVFAGDSGITINAQKNSPQSEGWKRNCRADCKKDFISLK